MNDIHAQAMIETANLVKNFGTFRAVDNISLTLYRGEVLGFLGPNGAGKSTTMRMITGYLRPTTGSVIINGIDMAEHPVEAQKIIGYLPEGAPLYSEMTPRQLLRFVARIRQLDKQVFVRQYDQVVEQLGLQSVLDKPIDTLSKGFKRRVGLAQAILHDPDILILDEPTDGLDPLQKREVRSLIHTMAKEKAIIISTHILEEVDAVCTRAMIISHGTVKADDTPDNLRQTFGQQNLDELFCRIAREDDAISERKAAS